mgnify:FL=1
MCIRDRFFQDNGETYTALGRTLTLKEAGQEILDGEIGVEPYKNGQRTACDYCPYHAVCGFDRKTSGYEFSRWKNRKTEEIWEEICKEQQ